MLYEKFAVKGLVVRPKPIVQKIRYRYRKPHLEIETYLEFNLKWHDIFYVNGECHFT